MHLFLIISKARSISGMLYWPTLPCFESSILRARFKSWMKQTRPSRLTMHPCACIDFHWFSILTCDKWTDWLTNGLKAWLTYRLIKILILGHTDRLKRLMDWLTDREEWLTLGLMDLLTDGWTDRLTDCCRDGQTFTWHDDTDFCEFSCIFMYFNLLINMGQT